MTDLPTGFEPPHTKPAGEFKRPFSAFAQLPTDYLHRAKKDLRNHAPGDGTFLATLSVLLQSLIDHDLRHPDRVAADEQAAKDREEAAEKAERAAAEKAQEEKAPADAVNA